MKKNLLIIIGLLLLLCSFSTNKYKTLKGYIFARGNEPFVYPEFETENNKRFLFTEGKYTKNDLLSYQGKKLEISGYINKDDSHDEVIYYIDVDNIEIIK